MEERHLSAEQLEKFSQPPSATAYSTRSDHKIFLAKDYYFRKANEIFGIGGWGVHHDAASVRYETHLHPKTGEAIGVVCYVQTTVTTRFSMPRTVVGFAGVQFGKNNGEIRNEQQVDVYILALRGAEARGLKDALAYFGPAFIVDMKGGKKNPGQRSKPTATQGFTLKLPPARPEEKIVENRDRQSSKPSTSELPEGGELRLHDLVAASLIKTDPVPALVGQIEAAETIEELDAIAKEVAALKLAKTDARRKDLVSAYDNRRSALATPA